MAVLRLEGSPAFWARLKRHGICEPGHSDPVLSSEYLSEGVLRDIAANRLNEPPFVLPHALSIQECSSFIRFFENGRPFKRTYNGVEQLSIRNANCVELPAEYAAIFHRIIERHAHEAFPLRSSFEHRLTNSPLMYRYDPHTRGFGKHHDLVNLGEVKRSKQPILGGDYTITLILNTLPNDGRGVLKIHDCGYDGQSFYSKAGTAILFRADYVHEVTRIGDVARYSAIARFKALNG